MNDKIKTVKQVCKCKDCGNESEMVITCTLESGHEHNKPAEKHIDGDKKHRVKGTGTCTHCGSEADIWIDL